LLQILDADGDNNEDKNFWQGRNDCLNLEKNLIFMEHHLSDEEARLDIFWGGIGTSDLNLHFLDSHVFIHFLASLVTIESTPITLKNQEYSIKMNR
jgi:hypothetical protein